jgi:sugar phosphate isomerase/epimerase
MPATLALSTCWNSYRHEDGYAMLKEIRQLGFSSVELGHAIRFSLWPGILKAREENLIRIASLHNFCPVPTSVMRPNPNCYEFSDPNPTVRRMAVKASEDTLRHAAQLGVGYVVFHLGSAGPWGITRKLERLMGEGKYLSRGYTQLKVQAVEKRRGLFDPTWARVKECLDPLVALAGELKVRLGFEIREDFEEFPHEEEMPGVLATYPEEVVGYWHDFGHAALKEFLGWHDHAETLRLRAPRLIGLHVHDCRRPNRDHLPLGHGEIDFPSLLPLVPQNAIATLELAPKTSAEQVIASRHLWNSFAAISA